MRLLVIDANSILNRAFYGIRLLSTKEGFHTNGIYGFLTTLEKLKEETSPDMIAIAFDLKAPTFRHEIYPEYKVNRKSMPPELVQQMPILKELLSAFGYKMVAVEGFEADDILGTMADICKENNCECIIATGDRDSLQLVDDKTVVRLATTKWGRPDVTMYDVEKIYQKYGVEPKQLIDIKALQGDAADNIPGVYGIGEKGAIELISKYGSINYIYENLKSLDIKDRIKDRLSSYKDEAFLSYKLGTIVRNVPISRDISSYAQKSMDRKKVCQILRKLEFFSLMEKMGLGTETQGESSINNNDDNSKEFTVLNCDNIDFADTAKTLDIFCEYDENLKIKKLAAVKDNDVFVIENEKLICELLRKPISWSVYDYKKFYRALLVNYDMDLSIIFDLLLAGYIANPSLSEYSPSFLLSESGKNFRINGNANDNFVKNACILATLRPYYTEQIKNNKQEFLLNDVEIQLSKVLVEMELQGFQIDDSALTKYSEELEKQANDLYIKIMDEVGHEFNVNSPKQLGIVLFEELKLPFAKKTKNGYSTSADILNKLKVDYPIVANILEYRTVSKLKSTFCDGILKLLDNTGRIHTTFNQTETKTGRISSTEPNLQNIPVRTPVGKNLRKFFCAREGYTLVDADYSQIELRMLAHVSNDNAMLAAFKNGEDIHTLTAAQVFDMPTNMVTELMRYRAKSINFGIMYGMGAFTLSQNLGISKREASEYIDNYFKHYEGVYSYMQDIIEKTRDTKFVETLFHRRRYLPEILSSSHSLRAFGERVAMNTPIQGSSADIIKLAMIKVSNRLKNENLDAKLILQVHDELIVEVKEEQAEIVKNLLKEEMEKAVDLKVPLLAEANIGKSWYEAKS